MKKIAFIFILMITLSFPLKSLAAEREVYIAIGDSLAAGQTPHSQIDAGYTDLIAIQLASKGRLASYSKALAFPGYTVNDVLQRVKTEEGQALLSTATLITISAGANDLLPLISRNADAGTLQFDQLAANFALNRARQDMQELLQQLKVTAPQAQVYVMGYYFPYPNVHATQKQGAIEQLAQLNAIMQQQAKLEGAEFVSVGEFFDQNGSAYLPNLKDVHPNQLGYMQMANAFLTTYESAGWQMVAAQIPQPNPLTFEQIMQQQTSETEEVAVVERISIEQYVVTYGYKKSPLL